ncbi:MAG: transposase [Tannerellaceae bacterium]|jgi:transposase|nr:transposase [Tannerellaceae bacterium]
MNSSEIFGIALGISFPWYVEKVELLESESSPLSELHTHLNFERGFQFTDSKGEKTTACDIVERSWQDMNFFQHHCYLHARVPRIKSKDGDIHQVRLPWARASGFTLLFEAYTIVYLWFWCDMAVEAKISPYSKFVNMIKSHWIGITAYFERKVTNGLLEGINSKIQLAKRRVRGYRNVRNFINMIYFLTAKLKFDYPLYST